MTSGTCTRRRVLLFHHGEVSVLRRSWCPRFTALVCTSKPFEKNQQHRRSPRLFIAPMAMLATLIP